MKRRILVFFLIPVACLLLVPAINIFSAPSLQTVRWTEKSFLYNIDFVSASTSRLLRPLGMSISPDKAIHGRDGWLYLGDEHQKTMSVDRTPQSGEDRAVAAKIHAAGRAWDAYFAARGVKLVRVMLAPNKGTVYPENMPRWARPAEPNGTDALLAANPAPRYIDLAAALRAAKSEGEAELYYRTDSHWNSYGAGLAFRTFAANVAQAVPELAWPAPESYRVVRMDSHSGGDLAQQLRIQGAFEERSPITEGLARAIDVTYIDFETGQAIRRGGTAVVDPPMRLVQVQHREALNQARVLWLRDSFGSAMAPWMVATFSDILQVHWSEAIGKDGKLVDMVDRWKPDYVFFTVIERASRDEAFTRMPPGAEPEADTVAPGAAVPPSAPKAPAREAVAAAAGPVFTATRKGTHHLASDGTRYRVEGSDAHVNFAFAPPYRLGDLPLLRLDLECRDGSESVPVQLFWLEEGMRNLDEQHSLGMTHRSGTRLIDMRTLARIDPDARILGVRIDIEPSGRCSSFDLQPPSAEASAE